MNAAQRALMEAIRLRAARQVNRSARPVRGLAACAGIRPIGAGPRRPLPLSDGGAAAPVRIRHPCTARLWRAQYEWFAHEPPALAAGVKPKTIQDLRAGRVPKSAAKDERAVYDFIQEVYKKRRVSDRTYKRVQGLLGDAVMIELVGILG